MHAHTVLLLLPPLLLLLLGAELPSSLSAAYPLDNVKSGGFAKRNDSVCYYKGRSHQDGDVIRVDEPCLVCRCKAGALNCGLRICAEVPDPPPHPCYIVHNPDQCCPQIICDTDRKDDDGIEVRTVSVGPKTGVDVCTVNGSVYAEGSALESSDQCEYCYCIRGEHKCIKPKCHAPFKDCKPIYTGKSCCPTHYDCREQLVDVPKKVHQPATYPGCIVEGTRYDEGEMLPKNSSSCENCYCMKGEVQCVPVMCETEFRGDCQPVFQSGQCCPASFKCSRETVRSFPDDLEATTTTTTDDGGATMTTMTTNTEEDAVAAETTTTPNPTDDIGPEHREMVDEDNLQKKTDEPPTETTGQVTTAEVDESTQTVLTSAPANDVSLRHRNSDLENRTTENGLSTTSPSVVADEVFAASSSLSHGEDEYDAYDYNEPRLPPSLPNLIIFPFVAADAVVKDEEEQAGTVKYEAGSIKRVGTDAPLYKDFFSPPIKTEGGFIPKQPLLLGDAYNGGPYPGKDGSFLQPKRPNRIPDTIIPSITLPPKPTSDQCLLGGRLFEHGELLSEPGECQSCICYYGEVMCQEIICPTLKAGCRQVAEKDPRSCCGKIICDDEDAVGPPEALEYSPSPVKATRRPSVTFGSVAAVTPNPFRDVIRTEPAPDLPSLIGEHQTKKPVTVTYKNLVVDYYPDFLVTTSREDVKKNYRNPVYRATEEYQNGIASTDNVTYTIQPSVTSSINGEDLVGKNSKYPYPVVFATSVRSASTEPVTLYDYYTVEEYKVTTKRDDASRRTPTRPRKTTEVPADRQSTRVPYKSTAKQQKHPGKIKSKTSTTAAAKGKHDGATKAPPPAKNSVDPFSLDSVLRFFFDTDTTTTTMMPPPSKKKDGGKKSTTGFLWEERSRQTTVRDGDNGEFITRPSTRKAEDTTTTSTTTKKSNAIGGLLKLAGCNIYGRMYRVGKIIAELSNPCLECVCTDFGVECNDLSC